MRLIWRGSSFTCQDCTIMKTKAVAVAAVTFIPAAVGWTDKWDYSKRFDAAGHAQLDCDGISQAASCCICMSIVFEVETQLNNTQNDYDMDVVFRISEEKKQIKYSRSEARILEVLDDVCEEVPSKFPSSDHVTKRMLSAACNGFIGEYEDELTRIFFDDFAPAKERMCVDKLQVCPRLDTTSKFEEL